jgi:hypothetical protein
VRWGTTVPPKAFINYSSSGQGFFLQDVSNLVIRGFTLRASIRAGIQVEPPNSNVVISDNRFFYINDSQNGSARPLTAQSSTNISILRNEFAYSSSEALHLTAQTTGSFSGLVAENHVHDVGDPNVLGPGTGGTPNCATITSDAPQPGSTLGDFSGLIVERNIFERCYDKSAILFESHCDGITVRDNVIRQLPLAFKFAANSGGASGHVSNHKIYNNLVYGLVPGSHNGDGNCFLFNGTGAIQNNIAWNNTCAGVLNYGVESQAGAGISGNKFYNNIFVKSGSGSLVNSVQAMTFQNNLLWSGSSTGSFGTIGGASVSCGTNGNRCANPLFVNAASNNYHIGSGSPAIDGATTTGIPAGRGADICNTRALSILGMSYQDCQAAVGTWDIGMDEYSTVSTGGASASLSTSDPSPTAAGNIVVNLTANQNLVQLPGPMTFTDSVGGTRTFSFTGSLPGISFTGVFAVDASIADGTGSFALPSGSLVTSTGATGNAITSVDGVPGASILINKSPPSTPTNLRFGN